MLQLKNQTIRVYHHHADLAPCVARKEQVLLVNVNLAYVATHTPDVDQNVSRTQIVHLRRLAYGPTAVTLARALAALGLTVKPSITYLCVRVHLEPEEMHLKDVM